METLNRVNGKHISSMCLKCTAEPNPTRGEFELRIEGLDGSDLRFTLFNMEGKVLRSHSIDASITRLFIGNCENGPYFVKIMDGDSGSRVIRINKCR